MCKKVRYHHHGNDEFRNNEAILRSAVIDIAKGLGIILVVVGHNRYFRENANDIYNIIYLFHMPLFFILSGMVISKTLDATSIKRRFIGLAKPYVMGTLLTLPLQLSKPSHPSNDTPVIGFLWATGNSIYNTPIWFLPSLFSATLIFWLIEKDKASVRKKLAIAFVLIFISFAAMEQGLGFNDLPMDKTGRPLGLPWSFDLAPLMAAFLILGQSLRQPVQKLQPSRTQLIIFSFTLLAILIGAYSAFDPRLDLNYRHIHSAASVTLCILFGTALIIGISFLISKASSQWISKSMETVGRSTLIILIMHSSVQSLLIQALNRLNILSMPTALFCSIGTILCLTLISEKIINKSQPLKRLFYAH